MPEPDLVVVHTSGSQMEADLASSALKAAGIDTMIQADSAGGMRPHMAWSSGGFKIMVRNEDAAIAREILDPSENLQPNS